ncbi:hypothetical protein GOP47_0006820 [Adiantum capillus-veneris]|uniref:OVATE domain-containing protein n=1 Tax=Adiantum capillus-veneris TaxID=13818 RepID=A0A9D4ZKT2_ADICA|nr:hypothetical protein GOP47_0006820 [Adiantum capillus-veneris]
MAPAVRDKVSQKPANRVEKPAIWQDVMVEVKETFRRIDRVKHSGFTLWDERRMRTGPALSHNRMARVKTQAPLRDFNLPPRTLREIENNRSQPPIVSFNHLQNLLGMCRRINAQSLLKERKKNPHDPCLYPVYLRRPVARPVTPVRPQRTSMTPRLASSAGTDRCRRSSTPPSAPVSRPSTPPISARKRPHTARPAVDDPPYAYAPRRFTLLLDISNRPAALGPLPAFTTRPPSAVSTPRPGSSRSQKGNSTSKPADQQSNKEPHPHVPPLKKLPIDRGTPKLASDRTFDRSSQQSGSTSSFGPMAAAYFNRRPRSAGDHRPLSAGDVNSERPMSRRQAGPSANQLKPVSESQTRSVALRDLSAPESKSASSQPERVSPTSSSSSSSQTDSSTTTMLDTERSETNTLSHVKGKGSLWSHAKPDERPPSRRGAKPSRKKKGFVAPSETTLSTTTTTEQSMQEASDDNASGKTSGASTLRGGSEHAKRSDPVVASSLKTRSFVPDGVDSGLKTPRAKPFPSSAEAKISTRRASSSFSVGEALDVKLQEPTQPAPASSSEEPSPGRPKVSFAAPDVEERKQSKQPMIEIIQPTLDQALDRLESSERAERRSEPTSSGDFALKTDGSTFQHGDKLQEHNIDAILRKSQRSMALDTASEDEDVDVRDSTDEDSIRTLTCIPSGSSSEMSQAEHEEDDEDDENGGGLHLAHPHNLQKQFSAAGTRNLREALQQQLPQEREQVDAQEETMGGGDIPTSVFIKFSADAYIDFKNSMMNLIRNDRLENGPDEALEDLFQYYMDLNPPVHHDVLREVIADIKVELKRMPRS